MKKLITGTIVLLYLQAWGQADSTKASLNLSGYAEIYYLYDTGNPVGQTRPSFVYSHNRHNEVNLNLGFIKAQYAGINLRSSLALMAGTYANANLAAEQGVLKNIFEANIGVKLSPNADLWIDAGIFPAHIGFESAIGKDCWTLSRSMIADNSPYYEAGAKLTYQPMNGEWLLSALWLNGWQRIQRPNNTPAFGTQVTFKPNEKILLNSSTFVGNDKPNDSRQMRYFHNFYGIFQLNEKISAIVDLDYGQEQVDKGSETYNEWSGGAILLKYRSSDKISLSARSEYYTDRNGVIVSNPLPVGFQVYGYSVNMDLSLGSQAVWRLEIKYYTSPDDIFTRDDKPVSNNVSLSTALAISIQ